MSKTKTNRRQFLGTALAGSALLVGQTSKSSKAREVQGPASPQHGAEMMLPEYILSGRKFRIAKVGCGNQGADDLREVLHQDIVALCDVDYDWAKEGFDMVSEDVPRFHDYRTMLDKLHDKIDAVMITTPDHTHAVIALAAMRRGKHVFVQKPLTHNIMEARALLHASRKYRVVTQMGIQGHAYRELRNMVDWIYAGVIGPVREVHCWTDRPIWDQNIARPQTPMPVPPRMNWDLWLGPAPERPFHEAYHPFHWRGWWDFGAGALGDIGCHTMDAAFYALNVAAARHIKVSSVNGPFNHETLPEWSIISYEVPARGKLPPLRLVWYDGGKKPDHPKHLEASRELKGNGQLLVGEEGSILADMRGESARIVPEARMQEVRKLKIPRLLWRSPGGYDEWIAACLGGPNCLANFEYAVPLTEFVHLGNLAIRARKEIHYDMREGRITNDPDINRFLGRRYRKGWEL